MVVNAAIAVGLMALIGFAAAALATTVAAWAMAFQLWFGTRKMGDAARFDTRFRSRVPRAVAASMAMALALYLGQLGLAETLVNPTWRYAGLALLITLGSLVYFGFGAAIGAFRLGDFRRNLRR